MLPHLACFETAWDDGLCWPNCNNQACGHNDCTWPQMATQCLHEEDLMMRDASTPPLHPNVALSIDGAGLPGLGPDKETSLHVYSISLSYRLTWHDARLANSPCASTLEGMLSSTDGTEPSIYRRRFWVPDVKRSTASRDQRRGRHRHGAHRRGGQRERELHAAAAL